MTIAAINQLPDDEKRALYARFVPQELLDQFGISRALQDAQGNSLVKFSFRPGSTDVVIDLRHQVGAEDPLLYAHLTDSMNGQLLVLLYIINDPSSPRFDVDRMPNGTPTEFGSARRNLPAELAAMQAGLAPGQIRRGLRILQHAIPAFEQFVIQAGQSNYFVEPLYYHNAVIFERYGLAYAKGLRRMQELHEGFQPGGELLERLDGSTLFRMPDQAESIRGRSWAIHDGIAGSSYTDVTMYKRIGHPAELNTFPGARW
jgi:hypothetical protein